MGLSLSPIRSFLSNVRTLFSLLFFPTLVATLAAIFSSVKWRIMGSSLMTQVVCCSGKSYRQVRLILLMENGFRNLDLKIAIP